MAQITRDSLVKKLFSDAKHYPYGFSRSGDFSIAESKALQQHGCLIAALVDGQILPESDEDKAYIDSALGRKDPESAAEKAWCKYQKRINRPKCGSIHGTKKAVNDGVSDSATTDDDLVLDIDDDIDIDIDD